VEVSFTHIIKSAELAFSVIVSRFLLGETNDFESYNVSCIIVFSIVSCIVSNCLRHYVILEIK
jgi:Triose-phosphate Transporter family